VKLPAENIDEVILKIRVALRCAGALRSGETLTSIDGWKAGVPGDHRPDYEPEQFDCLCSLHDDLLRRVAGAGVRFPIVGGSVSPALSPAVERFLVCVRGVAASFAGKPAGRAARSASTGLPRIADDLLQRSGRRPWATSGHHLPFQTSAYAGRLALELPTGRADLL
jgi:hypothetical protein